MVIFKTCPSPLMQKSVLNNTVLDSSLLKKAQNNGMQAPLLPTVLWTVEVQFFENVELAGVVPPSHRTLIHRVNEHRSLQSFILSPQFWQNLAAENKLSDEFYEWISGEAV